MAIEGASTAREIRLVRTVEALLDEAYGRGHEGVVTVIRDESGELEFQITDTLPE